MEKGKMIATRDGFGDEIVELGIVPAVDEWKEMNPNL